MDYWLTMVSDNIFNHICDGGRWSYDMFSDGLTIETTNQQQAVLTVLDLLGNRCDASQLRWASKCRRFIWKVRQTLEQSSNKKHIMYRYHLTWTHWNRIYKGQFVTLIILFWKSDLEGSGYGYLLFHKSIQPAHTHIITHIHTHTYIYISWQS